ncbi:MAG: hypothetical protein C4518_12565 [Desulfobacteraceae bacterium]|nr:MAG: hypothetical protein C4518_12565 [Desulfobacteraceae bacterium]
MVDYIYQLLIRFLDFQVFKFSGSAEPLGRDSALPAFSRYITESPLFFTALTLLSSKPFCA